MDVKKSTTRFICRYCNGCKKTNNYLRDLYAGITMDVEKQQPFIRLICGYYNGCKKTNNYLRNLYDDIAMDIRKTTTIYKAYMQVLHI
jgi:hypothetical protein